MNLWQLATEEVTQKRALGIGHWALGIGHWALGIGYSPLLLCSSAPLLLCSSAPLPLCPIIGSPVSS
ncbi:MAG: hypothetical protein HWQ41_26500 [Nostoc sp. NOS(2021)]|nr:hypothetical protein [Nostoc sp. NOS(2021)]